MIPPGSRYQAAEHNFTQAHRYSEWGYPLLEEHSERLFVRVSSREALYLMTTVPNPNVPPLEYYAKEDESMQFLAYKLLNDPKRWPEIAEVNPKVWYPLDMKIGEYIRIPS